MPGPTLFDDPDDAPPGDPSTEGLPAGDVPAGEKHLPDGVDWPDLNRAQRAAVTASLEPQLVVAGPGTGKTRVLVCRAAYLLSEHADRFRPSEVAVITFTRKAARQLTTRLTALVGPEAQHVRAGTIHQFCRRIVDAHTDRLDVPEDFVVASQAVTDAFWQRWFEENEDWCRSNDLTSFGQVKTRISRSKLGFETISGRLEEGREAYRDMLRRRGALDFDDLLTRARSLLTDHPDVCQSVREDTRALLVDEFQDTDPVQYDVMAGVGKSGHPDDGTHLFAVADDDQSIYRFRGAEPENLRRYIERYGCSREKGTYHVLQKNYRSNRAIYGVAETVLQGEERLKQRGDIETVDRTQQPVELVRCERPADELRYVLDRVRRWIDEGVPRSEIAVLARWNSTVQDLEHRFLRAGIACEASSTDPLLQVPSVRQLLAMLTLVDCMLRGTSFDGPLEDLLQAVLPETVYTRLVEFWRQQQDAQAARLWGTFQRLAGSQSAAEDAGLATEWHHLGRLYAAIGNVMQRARTDGATVGGLAAETLRQLGASTQLLGEVAGRLPDPASCEGVAAGARCLRRWQSARAPANQTGGDDLPRLLLYDRSTRRVEFWRQLVRRALDIGEGPSVTDTNHPAVFAAADERDPAPLTGRDVVVTADLDAFARYAGSYDALDADDPPTILLLGPRTTAEETMRLSGIDPDRVLPVAPATSRRPSLRLFRLLQATVAPAEPEPLFDSYVMVDLETTSLDTERCRIAEIGALRVDEGEVVDSFETLVELPPDLTADEEETLREVCGLDPDTDFADAVPEREAWEQFCAFAGARPLVAHNGRQFDFRILNRLRATYQGEVEARWTATYDTLPAAIELCPSVQRHTAEHLRRELLGEEESTAHRALADCRAQQRILDALQERRVRRQRTCALEPLLPLVVAALYDEARDADDEDAAFHLSDSDAVLLEVGYRWALRDASPARDVLRRYLPRALPELVRSTPALYDHVDEDQLISRETDRQPGLSGRVEALLSPFRDQPVAEGLSDALSHLALWGGEDPELGQDVVTLSTYHSAKGLEFERVICSGVHANAFPPFFASSREDRLESRRLLYVGMTRAEQHLVVTAPRRNQYGTLKRSPFLNDVPDELIERRDER